MRRCLIILSIVFFSVLSAEAGQPIGEVFQLGKDLPTSIRAAKDTTTPSSLVVRKWPKYLIHGKLDGKYDNDGTKYGPYTPLKEFELHTIPLLAFGFIAKGTKENFRSARNKFIPSYKNGWDDAIQFLPFMLSTGFNLGGYEGRSDFFRYFFSAGFSYAAMAIFVNGIKYTAKEMRPDGSSANSFPSGHTATAFTAATILHKEYGLTRSPWWSVLGYSVATTTGIMRTLNNRHWISDVLVGAGIGVLSTDIGYMIGDLIFKKKHLNREPRDGNENMWEHPSFFRFSLGMQFTSDIKMPNANVDFTTTYKLWEAPEASQFEDEFYTVLRNGNPFRIPDNFNALPGDRTYNHYSNSFPGNEAGSTIYKNPRLKVGTGTTVSAEAAYFFTKYIGAGARGRITTAPVVAEGLSSYWPEWDGNKYNMQLLPSESVTDVWSLADLSLGVYVAWPISPRHNLSAKALVGRRFFGSLDLMAAYDTEYQITGEDGNVMLYGDALYIDKTSSDNFSGGLTYTYSMGNGVAISAFCEYDYAKPTFDVEYSPYNGNTIDMLSTRSEFSYEQRVESITVGASMTVLF